MDNLQIIGRWMVAGGVLLVVIGGLIWALGRFTGLGQLGQIPGTVRIEGAGMTCIIPILGSIVLSLVLTLLLNVIIRFFNR
jgi:hypothetical protein